MTLSNSKLKKIIKIKIPKLNKQIKKFQIIDLKVYLMI